LTLRAGRSNGLPEARHDGTPAAMTMTALLCAPLLLPAALPAGSADAAPGAAFRAAALAEGAAPATLDGWRRDDRRSMARLVTAAVRGDAPAQDLLETLAPGCKDDARRRGPI
jgi:hypothetical protein